MRYEKQFSQSDQMTAFLSCVGEKEWNEDEMRVNGFNG